MEHTHTHDGSHHGDHTHQSTHHDAKAKMMRHAGALEAWLLPIFAKAPHIPQGGRKVLTDIVPWISLIFGILGLIGLISAGALAAIFSPLILLSGGIHGLWFLVNIILGIAGATLSVLSFNPLREMKKKGWDYAFYSLIIGAISAILSMIFSYYYGHIEGIIGIIIGAYLLFEIRDMYH